jgi:hypothetical protein
VHYSALLRCTCLQGSSGAADQGQAIKEAVQLLKEAGEQAVMVMVVCVLGVVGDACVRVCFAGGRYLRSLRVAPNHYDREPRMVTWVVGVSHSYIPTLPLQAVGVPHPSRFSAGHMH